MRSKSLLKLSFPSPRLLKSLSQIVNVELLLRRHPPDAVIAFLDQLRSEYKKELGDLIKNNKTDPKINDLVAKNFRIKMAINTIKNAKVMKEVA